MSSSSKPLPPNAEDLVFACLESEDPPAALEALCKDQPEVADTYRGIFASLDRHGLLDRSGRRADSRKGNIDDHPEKLGPYRIVEKLGHGGMGVVFLGIDETLGRKVAVKLIRPEQLYVPGNKERFKREVEALLELSHSGIVRVLGAGEDQGIPYYAMEFVEGLSLAELIQGLQAQTPARLEGKDLLARLEGISTKHASTSGTRLTEELGLLGWPELCLRLISEAAEALQHAHEQQIIHRDVKPSNLLLTQAGHLRLVDFGLARIEDGQNLTKSTAELGSLPYLAPEYLAGPSVRLDPRQDVYSLGITLYELLTLHCPYLGKDQEETRRRILEAHPTDPRKLNPKISWDLATVCLTAMDPDPARRYQTCADLLQDLSNLRSKRPIHATRPKPLLRLRRWAERHPRASAVLMTGSFLLLISSFLYALSEASSRRRFEDLYEQSRHLAYVGNLRAANMDFESDEVADGILRLLRCPEDLRGMEWQFLSRRMDQSLRILSKSRTPLNDLALSADGLLLASSDRRPGLEVLGMPEGKVIMDIVLEEEANRLCFLSDSHRLILGGLDGIVRIYDVDKGILARELISDPRPTNQAISALLHLPKQGLLAVGYHSGSVHLWDLESGTLRFKKKIHTSSIQSLSVNADASLLLSASVDHTAGLWTLPDLEQKLRVKHTSWVLGGTFLESGTSILTCSNLGGLIQTRIDSGESKQLSAGRLQVSANAITFTADRTRFFTGGRALFSQRIARPDLVDKLLGHQATIFALALHPTQKTIYSASQDGTIREWSTNTTKSVRSLARSEHAIRAVAWLDATRWLAGDSRGKLLRGQLDETNPVRTQSLKGGRIHKILELAPEEFAVSTENGSLSFFTWDETEPYQTLQTDSPLIELQRLEGRLLAQSKDGIVLDIRRVQGTWKATKLQLGHQVSTMAGSGLDDSIYWAAEDGVLYRWDPQGKQTRIQSLGSKKVTRIRPIQQGKRMAITGANHAIWLLDVETGVIDSRLEGHIRVPDSILMQKGSNRLISTGGFEMKLIIWDPDLEENLLGIRLPAASFDLSLNPDGNKMLCGLMWGHVVLCDASPISRKLELTKAASAMEITSDHSDTR